MKHPDSETLKQLKDKAETDPMKAVDELRDHKSRRNPSLGCADLVLDSTQSVIEFIELVTQPIERLPVELARSRL